MLHVQENVGTPLIQQIILSNVFNAYKVANECNSKENIYIKNATFYQKKSTLKRFNVPQQLHIKYWFTVLHFNTDFIDNV